MANHPALTQSFVARATVPGTHPLARYLYNLMTVKSSNLCLAADVTTSSQLLEVAEEVGDYICVLKTHADIIYDWSETTAIALQDIAQRKSFLVFEDRKFGDIGSTVQRQYTAGPLQIIRWASLTNAHVFPGPAVVTALKSAARSSRRSYDQAVQTSISASDERDASGAGRPPGLPSEESSDSIVSTTTIETRVEPSPSRGASISGIASGGDVSKALENLGQAPSERGLLLLAQMSSEDNLFSPSYTQACKDLARQHRDFVVGFIAQETLNSAPGDNFITFTPGISLPPRDSEQISGRKTSTDGLGQQYNTPRDIILGKGTDVAIVGRGILGSRNRAGEAQRYRDEAWAAYKARLATS